MTKCIFSIFLISITTAVNAVSNKCDSAIKSKSTAEEDTAWKCIENISNEISKGDINSIRYGLSILPSTDAGFTSVIKQSLAYALPYRSVVILNNLKNNMDVFRNICGMPFIEPEKLFIKGYYKKTHAALISLSNHADAETGKLAQICLNELDKGYKLYFPAKLSPGHLK